MVDDGVGSNGQNTQEARRPPEPELPTVPGIGQTARPGSYSSLSESLERTGRHPVLIFGSSRAGKSMLIMSLIQALHASRTVDVQLGEPVLDRADPRCEERHRQAKTFFDRGLYEVDSGQPLLATQGEPFFIPIDIKPRNSRLPAVKLAFLDGRGEDYIPSEDRNTDFYKPLGEDIKELLQVFSYGVTMVYIAPYSVGGGHERDTRESNFGILGVQRAYHDFRKLRRNDFHAFLLTKWDQLASPMDADELFSMVGPKDVDDVLNDRYGQSWGGFQALPLEGPAQDRRVFMQYSSGYFVEGKPKRPPANFVDAYLRYPRTLLNWLYGNARRYRLTTEDGSRLVLRESLFDDVIGPGETRVTVTDRLAALLTAR